MSESNKERFSQIRRNLQSGNKDLILEGIQDAAEHGNLSLLADLLTVYRDNTDTEIRNELDGILNNLKITGTEEVFVEALLDKSFAAVHTQILAFMWSSGLNIPEHLSVLVRVCLSGSFMQALEGFTLIESMDGPFPEEQILDSLLQVRAYLEKAVSGEMKELVQQLDAFLKELDREQ